MSGYTAKLPPLNPSQHDAMLYTTGPLLVLAGAGSGKTAVITRKIAHLIQNCNMPAHRIVAMTFTNKAAREMKERVGKLLPSDQLRGLTVSTFHNFGLNFRRNFLNYGTPIKMPNKRLKQTNIRCHSFCKETAVKHLSS